MEAADRINNAVTTLISYKDTAVGYSIAAAHAATLREASVPYSFAPSNDPEHPLQLQVPADQMRRASSLIELVGLGADIARAA